MTSEKIAAMEMVKRLIEPRPMTQRVMAKNNTCLDLMNAIAELPDGGVECVMGKEEFIQAYVLSRASAISVIPTGAKLVADAVSKWDKIQESVKE